MEKRDFFDLSRFSDLAHQLPLLESQYLRSTKFGGNLNRGKPSWLLSMECHEKLLRGMLSSPYGGGVGECLLDKIESGEPIVISMLDGSTVTLNNTVEALVVLVERFGWRRGTPNGGINWRDDKAAAYVLGMCQRVERHFSLREIVARIVDERPEMILEFASTWGKLIRNKTIRVLKQDEPCLYEIANGH